jgi:hypothetical protein
MRTRSRSIAHAVRRAAIHGLAIPVLSLGCGGKAEPTEPTEPAEASVPAEASAPACAVSSTTSIGGGCGDEQFPLDGTFDSCGTYAPPSGGQAVLPPSQCAVICPQSSGSAALSCSIYARAPNDGSMAIDCVYQTCPEPPPLGRRPAGLYPYSAEPELTPMARQLALMAHLEAASVDAFLHMARELDAHQAPASLSRAARRAARDEVRHARTMARFAERSGARVSAPRVKSSPVRSLEAIAIENAIEGCVRETYGAAVSSMQAAQAKDARVRAAMKRIAEDEARHAALSWAVARWIETRIDTNARRRIAAARAEAVETLAREVAACTESMVTERLGLPTAAQSRAVLDALRASVWGNAASSG